MYCIYLSLSLSLYIYIYIYIWRCVYIVLRRFASGSRERCQEDLQSVLWYVCSNVFDDSLMEVLALVPSLLSSCAQPG